LLTVGISDYTMPTDNKAINETNVDTASVPICRKHSLPPKTQAPSIPSFLGSSVKKEVQRLLKKLIWRIFRVRKEKPL
jgi:hypothetical protein